MKLVRKIYEKAFKEKAVQLSYERTKTTELARDLEITATQFLKRCKEFEKEVFLEKEILNQVPNKKKFTN